ncbi:MAG: LytR/AlgR family response regulator transcription factor [Saprospiraceae bacterium]
MLRIALIDDEADARETLRLQLKYYAAPIEIVFMADSVASALTQLQTHEPDLLLLDLLMRDGTGFDLLKYFPNPAFKVIFTTAHDQFALRAFEYHAVNYLLKPIDPQQLFKAIGHVQQNLSSANATTQLANLQQSYESQTLDRIFLPNNDGFEIVQIADILYLEADGNYTYVYTESGKKIFVVKSLRSLEELLPRDEFYRIHHSFIVRLTAITSFSKAEGDIVQLSNGKNIPVARRRKNGLFELLGKR